MNIWKQGGLPLWKRGFPFFLAMPRTALERLRATAAKQVWTERPVWKRAALVGGMTASWPTVSLGSAVTAARELAKENKVAFLPSFGRLYAAALTHNLPPHQSSFYQIVVGSADMSDFLIPADQRILSKMSIARGAVLDDVQNKVRFERICQDRRLSCVPTLASFDNGVVSGEDRLREWRGPIFVKALKGNRGAGAQQWARTDRGYLSPDGRDLDVDKLIAMFRVQCCIVQPVLEDCEALRKLGSVALSSLRLVTAKGATTPSTVIAAALSLADKSGSVISHPGTMCGIRLEDGIIIQAGAVREKDREGKAAGDQLLGAELPSWPETIDLVRRAHDQAFSAFVTLGWDVALTPNGPFLLETNVSWSAAQHQIRTGPLGKTALAQIIDELLSTPSGDLQPVRT